jgi:hypothetical protein
LKGEALMQDDIKMHEEAESTMLKFLKRTKEGDFAEIPNVPMTYIRIYEKREVCYDEETYSYYYS